MVKFYASWWKVWTEGNRMHVHPFNKTFIIFAIRKVLRLRRLWCRRSSRALLVKRIGILSQVALQSAAIGLTWKFKYRRCYLAGSFDPSSFAQNSISVAQICWNLKSKLQSWSYNRKSRLTTNDVHPEWIKAFWIIFNRRNTLLSYYAQFTTMLSLFGEMKITTQLIEDFARTLSKLCVLPSFNIFFN